MLPLSLRQNTKQINGFIPQTKYDVNQAAKKQLLPITTRDFANLQRHWSNPVKSQNGLSSFTQQGDFQYGRANVLTDHFQYSRQNYPASYSSNRYDI